MDAERLKIKIRDLRIELRGVERKLKELESSHPPREQFISERGGLMRRQMMELEDKIDRAATELLEVQE